MLMIAVQCAKEVGAITTLEASNLSVLLKSIDGQTVAVDLSIWMMAAKNQVRENFQSGLALCVCYKRPMSCDLL
jgi:hypothetical protein